MKTFIAIFLFSLAVIAQSKPTIVSSPNGQVSLHFDITAEGVPRYGVERRGRGLVVEMSPLGLVRSDADFSRGLKIEAVTVPQPYRDRYETLTSKRRLNDFRARRFFVRLQTSELKDMGIEFLVSDDGVAFRYEFPGYDVETHDLRATQPRRIENEATSFAFPEATRAWLQPKAPARTGWKESQPSYEEYYEKEIPVGTPSRLGAGWVFPALFRNGETWIAITESGFLPNFSGGFLAHESPGGVYRMAMPDAKERRSDDEPYKPESPLPWKTPWRVIVVGDLRKVTESTLGTDVAEAAKGPLMKDLPGKSSWSWVLLGDGATTYGPQVNFIDYAARMGWKYCLVDALWDTQIGRDKVAELVRYARTKNVRIILWYNSAGAWNSTPMGPRNLMVERETRVKEFEWLRSIGVAGLKVDFFGGDGQSFMKYYRDILDDALKYGLAMNFHGATLPRGLARTYPNLMTMEAVRGMEFATFEQKNADEVPTHAAMLPFTRNLFDPMDFTPVAPSILNKKVARRTTSAFELATAVLFTSGIQHYAETPDGLAKSPEFVTEFLKAVPSVWDEMRFVDGYPGKYVVIARRAGQDWFIGGINGEDAPREITIDPRILKGAGRFNVVADGAEQNLSYVKTETTAGKPFKVLMKPRGGFAAWPGR